jgi:hypothetical protein
MNGMGGICSTHGEMINTYEVFVVNPKGKRPLGKFRHK